MAHSVHLAIIVGVGLHMSCHSYFFAQTNMHSLTYPMLFQSRLIPNVANRAFNTDNTCDSTGMIAARSSVKYEIWSARSSSSVVGGVGLVGAGGVSVGRTVGEDVGLDVTGAEVCDGPHSSHDEHFIQSHFVSQGAGSV